MPFFPLRIRIVYDVCRENSFSLSSNSSSAINHKCASRFPKDVLEEVLASVKVLDALVAYNLALVHTSHNQASSINYRCNKQRLTEVENEGSLTLNDLLGDDKDDRGAGASMALADDSSVATPLGRIAKKYEPLLVIFPELQSVPVTRLDTLAGLWESVVSETNGIERGAQNVDKAGGLLRENILALEEVCIHNFIRSGADSPASAGAQVCVECGEEGRVHCVVCQKHFCAVCAKGTEVLLQVALRRSVVNNGEDEEYDEDATFGECQNCCQPVYLPPANPPASLLCFACSSLRQCAHCLNCPSKLRGSRGDSLQKLFCLKCATGAYNLGTLLRNLQESLILPCPRFVNPEHVSVAPPNSEAFVVTAANEALTLLKPSETAVIASHVYSHGAQSSKVGAAFQSCLILPSITHIIIEGKRLYNNAASKTWLAKLTSACLASEAKEVALERCRRVGALAETDDKRSPSFELSTFEGPMLLQGEHPRLLLDIMILFCIQGAWSAEEAHTPAIMADATVQCLQKWKPVTLPPPYSSYSWLFSACLREAQHICSTRAPWHPGSCPIPDCSVQPSYSALLMAWNSASPGAPSQLASAFSCGHVPSLVSPSVEASRCLNPACAQLPSQIYTRDFSIRGVDDGKPPLKMSRCSHCNMPSSFGRSIFDITDVLRNTLKRERVSLLPKLARLSHSSIRQKEESCRDL